MIYLGYVAGGLCRDTHAPTKDANGDPIKPPRVLKQLWVQEALRRIGVDSWCGTKVEFKRVGTRRIADRFERPYMPNYLFIDIPLDKFSAAMAVDYLAPSLQMVPKAEIAAIQQWQAGVNEAYNAALLVDGNSKAAIAEYTRGQALHATRGPFEGFPMWFERVAQQAHDKWPKIVASVEVMGGRVDVRLDPLDVKAFS